VSALRDEVHTAFSPALSASWRELAASYGMYENEPWLRGLERRLDPRYILVHDDEGLAGGAVCYLVRTREDLLRIGAYYDVTFYHFGSLSSGSIPQIPKESALPLVITGPPLSGTEHRILLRPGLSDAARLAVLARLLDRVESIGEEIGARLVTIAHLRLERLKDVLALRPQAIPGFVAAMMSLAVPTSFEAWLDQLHGKARWNVKNEMKCLAAEGMRIETWKSEACRPFLKRLYMDTLNKYPEGYGDPHHVDEFAETTLDACYSSTEESRAFVSLKGDQPMGAALAFRWGDLYQLKLNVHEHSASQKSALYFNQVYGMIAEAIREGVRSIDFGGAGSKGKLLRGCRALPAFSAFLPRKDCPLQEHRKFLADQNRKLLAAERADIEAYGQFGPQQAEEDLGSAIAFAEAFT
jgi:hypothetical protein